MSKEKNSGLLINGSLKKSGVSFYTRGGRMVMRTAVSNQPERRTQAQFVVRQRMKHATMVWSSLRVVKPMFGTGNGYARFRSLMSALPAVYTPQAGPNCMAQLLLPGMPMSEGTLPPVHQWLGEVGGTPALLTDAPAAEPQRAEEWRLYTVVQDLSSGTPHLNAYVRTLARTDFAEADGCLAIEGEEFALADRGWALVHVVGEACSTQSIVTRCTAYEPFITEEAMHAAAKSYGGFTE